MAGPKLPRNERLQNDKGQVDQRFLRYWDQIKTRAYDYVATFNNIVNLAAISSADADNDYLVIYDATDQTVKRISPANLVSSGVPDANLVETVATTSGTVVTAATFDPASFAASGYRDLHVRLNGVSATGGPGFRVDVSDDAGLSWTPSAATITGLGISRSSTTLSPMVQYNGFFVIGNAADAVQGAVSIQSFTESETAFPKAFSVSSYSNLSLDSFGSGHVIGLGKINRVRVSPISGSFDAGSFSVYVK